MRYSDATQLQRTRDLGLSGRSMPCFAGLQDCNRRAALRHLAVAGSTLLLPIAFSATAHADVFGEEVIPEDKFQQRLDLLKSTRERIQAIQDLSRAAVRNEALPIDAYESIARVQADELEKFFALQPDVVEAVESPVGQEVPGVIADDAKFDTFLRQESDLLRSAAQRFDDSEDRVSRYVIERTVITRETIITETTKAAKEGRPVLTTNEVVTQNRERTEKFVSELRRLEKEKTVAENAGTVERQAANDGLATSGATLLAFNGVAAAVSAGSCSAFCLVSAAVGGVLCWVSVVS